MLSFTVKMKCYWQQYVAAAMMALLGVLWDAIPAYAKTSDTIKDIAKGKSNGAFSRVQTQVRKVGGSAFDFVKTILIIAGIVSFAAAGICLAITKNSTKHQENKSWIFRIFIGLGIGFTAATIVTLTYDVISGI